MPRLALRWRLLLVLMLAVMPLAELYVLILVGQSLGVLSTLALLLLAVLVGGWLIRREGSRAWRALVTGAESGAMPGRELTDSALVLLGGLLILSPGFISDLLGVLLVLPVTRPIFRRALTGALHARRPGAGPSGPVIRGEIVDE